LFLKNIINSNKFRRYIEKISSYAASIKQERPIQYALAKLFDKEKFIFAMERIDKFDLYVDGISIELKFYYEEDIQLKLEKEFNKANQDIKFLLKELKENPRSTSGLSIPILRDVIDKRPNIFILIFLSRDLTNTLKNDLKYINHSRECLRYNKQVSNYPFNNPNKLKIVEKYLECIKSERNFDCYPININTNTKFPSSYHFYICYFSPYEN